MASIAFSPFRVPSGTIEPSEAAFAEPASRGAGLVGVEQHQRPGRRSYNGLDETVVVGRNLGKRVPEGLAVVVIAEQEMAGGSQVIQGTLQEVIGCGFAAVGEIAGEEDEGGVPLGLVDVGDGGSQPGLWIQPAEPFSGRDQVRIGQVYEFHRRSSHGDLQDSQRFLMAL